MVEAPLPTKTGISTASKWSPAPLTSAASSHLDLVRAIAAWAVMWGHLRSLFFLDYQELAKPSRAIGFIYFLTGFGHQAVMVFFILSGFLISTSVFKMLATEKWSWTEYAISRSARLYAVLIPGLLLGMLWDFVGSKAFATSGLYINPLNTFGNAIVRDNLTVANFFGNLFFLQTIKCATFGSNGPLWSLANEFWYYVLFPLGLFAGIAWTKRQPGRAVLLTLSAIAVSYFVGTAILAGFLIWLAGTLLVVAHKNLRLGSIVGNIIYSGAAFLCLLASLYAARMDKWSWTGSDLAVGLTFAFFLFGLLQIEWPLQPRMYARVTKRLAGFSYSLYVLHFPLLLFLRAWTTPGKRWQPNLRHLLLGILLGGAVLLFAWAISLFTENRTSAVRNYLRAKVPGTQFRAMAR